MNRAVSEKNHNIYFVPGLQRGLRVLEIVARANKPLSVTEIAQQMELSRSSTFRLVYTLQYEGFLHPTSADMRTFEMGSRVLNLGFSYLAKQDIIQIARRDLEGLRDSTNISAHLAIRDQFEVLFLDCVQTRTGFLSNVNVGARVPAYASPMGWLMLSELPNRELASLYKDVQFERITDKTPTDLSGLMQAIAKASADGYVFSHGIMEPGGASVSAPVYNSEGMVAAAIDISGPESAFDSTKDEAFYVHAVQATAASISAKLGYRG